MSFVAAAVGAVAFGASAVLGNQAKQKAKGQAGQAERDAQAAQDAADAKLAQQHSQDIQAQSQDAELARVALGGGTLDSRPSLRGRPRALVGNAPASGSFATPLASPLANPLPRKTLLGS